MAERRKYNLDEGAPLSARGGGGGRMLGEAVKPAWAQSKMQARMDARKAAAEARPKPTAKESWDKFKTKNKLKGDGGLKFSRGGKVPGNGRDYCK